MYRTIAVMHRTFAKSAMLVLMACQCVGLVAQESKPTLYFENVSVDGVTSSLKINSNTLTTVSERLGKLGAGTIQDTTLLRVDLSRRISAAEMHWVIRRAIMQGYLSIALATRSEENIANSPSSIAKQAPEFINMIRMSSGTRFRWMPAVAPAFSRFPTEIDDWVVREVGDRKDVLVVDDENAVISGEYLASAENVAQDKGASTVHFRLTDHGNELLSKMRKKYAVEENQKQGGLILVVDGEVFGLVSISKDAEGKQLLVVHDMTSGAQDFILAIANSGVLPQRLQPVYVQAADRQ